MIPHLTERVAQARGGVLTSGDGGFATFFWVFFGTLALEMVGEVWRQSLGGVGYTADFTPWTGLLVAMLPAISARRALHDEAAQRVTHAVVALTAAALTPAALAHYESLSRDAHTGMGHMRAPTVFATSAAFAAIVVWPLFSRATRLMRRVVPIAALALAIASLGAATALAPGLWSRPEARAMLREARAVTVLAPPETGPVVSDAGVRQVGAGWLPFTVLARCERWYCDLHGQPSLAPPHTFVGYRYPSLLRDRPVTVRRAGDLWLLEQPTGETVFFDDGRYASFATLAGRVRPPDAWLFGALMGSAAALSLLARARRRRRRLALDATWFTVTVQPDGTAVDAEGTVYAVEVSGPMPPPGPAYAQRDDTARPTYRATAVPVLRALLPGDATTLAQALDAWVLARDAQALTAAAWGGGSLLAWAWTARLG